jgi:hypothetical protein
MCSATRATLVFLALGLFGLLTTFDSVRSLIISLVLSTKKSNVRFGINCNPSFLARGSAQGNKTTSDIVDIKTSIDDNDSAYLHLETH